MVTIRTKSIGHATWVKNKFGESEWHYSPYSTTQRKLACGKLMPNVRDERTISDIPAENKCSICCFELQEKRKDRRKQRITVVSGNNQFTLGDNNEKSSKLILIQPKEPHLKPKDEETKHYIVYHKVSTQGRYELQDQQFWASTKKSFKNKAHNMIGSMVWIIEGVGKAPVKYSLAANFIISTHEMSDISEATHIFKGGTGNIFSIDLSNTTWFSQLVNQAGNFGIGMLPLKNAVHIENLERLVQTHHNVQYPDEIVVSDLKTDEKIFIEGAVKNVTVNKFERDPKAREKCISHYKPICVVCGLDFETRYGEIGRGYIHVHHLNPLALLKAVHEVDPIRDLRPVCPNCHAMLHRGNPVLTIEELKAILTLV